LGRGRKGRWRCYLECGGTGSRALGGGTCGAIGGAPLKARHLEVEDYRGAEGFGEGRGHRRLAQVGGGIGRHARGRIIKGTA